VFKISKLIQIVCISIAIIFCSLVFVTFLSVKKMCFRQLITQEQQQKIEKNRELLRTRYYAQQFQVNTQDNITISGILIEREQAKRLVIVCHGYARTKEAMANFVELFSDAHVVLFDFRGHGDSGGDMITFGCHEENDIAAVIKWLQKHNIIKSLPLIGFGCSMGGAILLGAVAHGISFDGLIIDSSFANLYEQIAHVFTRKTHLPRIPCMFFAQCWFRYLANCDIETINPGEYAKLVTCPVLIIHSKDDDFTPINHAYAIYDNLAGKKKLHVVQGAEHARCCKVCPVTYKKEINEFLMAYQPA
jgi:pimeloyl-ACP methyl ester carboxylesterase